MVLYYLDSYAIIEIVLGNRNYQQYKGKEVITSKLNLFEVHFKFLREFGTERANAALQEYYKYAIDYGPEEIIGASRFKLQHRKRNISPTDALGYIIALRNGAKFLTGDKEFKDMNNVEFMK